MGEGKRKRSFSRQRDMDKIVIEILSGGELTSYKGRYGDFEFEGETKGDESNIRDLVARMLEARKDLPERLRLMLTTVIGYIELMVKGDAEVSYVTTSAGIDFRADCMVGVKASLLYDIEGAYGGDDYTGWIVNLRGVFEGYDGYSFDSRHEVKLKLKPGKDLDIEVLRTQLTLLTKMAYNAHNARRHGLCV
jgi:hypothetical protein